MQGHRRLRLPTAAALSASAAASLLAVLLSGCSGGKPADESQIAAHINDGEISVHQVQAILQRQPTLPAATAQNAAAQVLEVLIDQELAAQAATKRGLESDPAVVQSLQLARREALARAYHDRAAAQVVPPSSDEIDRYYDAHPELFAQRQFYTLQELTVDAAPGQLQGLDDALKAAKGAEAAVAAVRERGLRHAARQFVQAAEDVPLGLLDRIAGPTPGKSVLLPQPGGARIFTVVQVQLAPVDRRTAHDAIAKYLFAERKRKAVAESMHALRHEARLRYVGSFAKAAPTSAADQAPPTGRP